MTSIWVTTIVIAVSIGVLSIALAIGPPEAAGEAKKLRVNFLVESAHTRPPWSGFWGRRRKKCVSQMRHSPYPARAATSTAQLFGSPTPIRRGVVVTVVSLLSLLTPVACHGHGRLATQQTDSTGSLNSGSLNPFTAEDLVALIGNAGLAAPNPRDVTQRDCPAIGCAEKVETDTVSIIKFRTGGQAQLYAGSMHSVFQITDVVMTFSPSLPTSQQRAYEDVLRHAIE
jgi:hypothetical protein